MSLGKSSVQAEHSRCLTPSESTAVDGAGEIPEPWLTSRPVLALQINLQTTDTSAGLKSHSLSHPLKPPPQQEAALQGQVSFKNWCTPTALHDAEGSKPHKNVKELLSSLLCNMLRWENFPFHQCPIQHQTPPAKGEAQSTHRPRSCGMTSGMDTQQHQYFFHNPQNYLDLGNQVFSSSGIEEKSTGVCKTLKEQHSI